MNELPIFKFALRKDLEDDKRFLPARGEPKATGWDVRAAHTNKCPLIIKPFERAKIPLGFRGLCPDGWWYELNPRSSSFAKKNLHALIGTVDETFEGELLFACQYIPEVAFETDVYEDKPSYSNDIVMRAESRIVAPNLIIEFGEAIGQIIPVRRKEMIIMELSNEDIEKEYKQRAAKRGDGGFGSTSK